MTFRLDILNDIIKLRTRGSHQLSNKCNLAWLRIVLSFTGCLLDFLRYFKLFIWRMACSWANLRIYLLSCLKAFKNRFIHSNLVYIRAKYTNCENSWNLHSILRSWSNALISFCLALIKSDRIIPCEGLMNSVYGERLQLMYLGRSNRWLAAVLHINIINT